jgi:hypothetical protein
MKPIENIFNLIEKEFSDGFFLNEEVIHFAQSTLGMEREELIAAISSGDPEWTGVLDLIISPNHDLKRAVEQYIPSEGINEEDAGYLTDKVHSLVLSTDIKIKGNKSEIKIALFPGLINGYLNKLMLAKEVPCKEVLTAQGTWEIFNLEILVHLRRRGADIRKRGINICGVITRLRDYGISAAETIKSIDLISDTAKRYPGETDLLSMVAAERSFWQRMREDKKFVDDAVDKYSMEFVMMQKINPGVFSIQDIEKKIVTADQILRLCSRNSILP